MDPDQSDHAQTKVWPVPAAGATKERSSKSGNDKVRKSSNQGNENTNAQLPIGSPSPCGACKFLRRKCAAGCVFSPYFGPDQGSARFAAVHKVFGASNVSKLLLNIPTHRRQDAVLTISYEAQARLSDPVYGCVSTILALQHQVTSLQAELAMVQAQLINNKVAVANALRNAAQQDQEMSFLHLGQSYSNASSTTNNLISVTNDCYASALDLVDAAPAAIASRRLEPLQLPTSMADDKEEDSRNTIDVIATSNLGCK